MRTRPGQGILARRRSQRSTDSDNRWARRGRAGGRRGRQSARSSLVLHGRDFMTGPVGGRARRSAGTAIGVDASANVRASAKMPHQADGSRRGPSGRPCRPSAFRAFPRRRAARAAQDEPEQDGRQEPHEQTRSAGPTPSTASRTGTTTLGSPQPSEPPHVRADEQGRDDADRAVDGHGPAHQHAGVRRQRLAVVLDRDARAPPPAPRGCR